MKTQNKRLNHGVGINDMDKVSYVDENGKRQNHRFYSTWNTMLQRCYSEYWQTTYPTYKGCAVCEEWKTLSNFKRWYDRNYIKGCELDKDLLSDGTKIYSPETCVFIPKDVNIFFADGRGCRKNRDLPVGVIRAPYNNEKYAARCNFEKNGKNGLHHIGTYDTPEEAHEAYLVVKRKTADILADKYEGKIPQFIIDKIRTHY